MSDYEDENFEMDETEECWGVQTHVLQNLKANSNCIDTIHRKNVELSI